MSFSRAIFAFALVMLVAGFFGSRMVANYLFGNTPARAISVADSSSTSRITPTPRKTAASRPHVKALPTVMPAARVRPSATATVRPTPTITVTPTPSPTTGVVTLARYWVGAASIRRGQMVTIGYVVSNGTGRIARVFLGASVKSSRSASWVAGELNDTAHDVVAVVPPGVSTHVRYFAFPAGARPGPYDVAWGLRDAANGEREALATAPGALQVLR